MFIGHGQWILGGGDDRTSKVDICVYHTVGLFECLRMLFGLKNAPQIYQCLIDHALYRYLKIGTEKMRPQQISLG